MSKSNNCAVARRDHQQSIRRRPHKEGGGSHTRRPIDEPVGMRMHDDRVDDDGMSHGIAVSHHACMHAQSMIDTLCRIHAAGRAARGPAGQGARHADAHASQLLARQLSEEEEQAAKACQSRLGVTHGTAPSAARI